MLGRVPAYIMVLHLSIAKLVGRLYVVVIALLLAAVVALVAPLFCNGSAIKAVLRGDLDTALVYASTDDLWLASRSLLNAGADPNAETPNGQPLLLAIARQGNASMARLLIAGGADPLAANSEGKTALDIARELHHGEMTKLLESLQASDAPSRASAE